MIYQNYRPKDFKDFIGNDFIVSSLRGYLGRDEHPHAFLFSGPSGVGKTSLARLFASKMGIEDTEILEINASSTRGIDTIREIDEYVSTPPFVGYKRIIILDEAHSLTNVAQQALLKIVEDIPDYQYFVFCTTEPNKLIKTLYNRLDHYKVLPLLKSEILKLLDNVGKRAKLTKPSVDVLNAIADKSQGCARTALILLEKQIGLPDVEAITLIKSTSDNGEDNVEVIELCRKLINGKPNEVLSIYKSLKEEPETIKRIMLNYFHTCAISSTNGVSKYISAIKILGLYDLSQMGKAGLIAAVFDIKEIFKPKLRGVYKGEPVYE